MFSQTDYSQLLEDWTMKSAEETAENVKRRARMPFLWQRSQKVRKGVSPSEVVYEEDRLKLLHYVSDTPPVYKTPLVFVFALVNRPYILDLKEGKSVVNHFVKAGLGSRVIAFTRP